MLLTTLSLGVNPCETVASGVQAALIAAKDVNGAALLTNVYLTFDATQADAILANPPIEALPACYINFPTEAYQISENIQGPVNGEVTFQLYFVYYAGIQPTNFNVLRDRHILACLKALAWNVAGYTAGTLATSLQATFKWDSSRMILADHDTPLKYLDREMKPDTGVVITRVDRPAIVYGFQ